jgi:hypothetical protein
MVSLGNLTAKLNPTVSSSSVRSNHGYFVYEEHVGGTLTGAAQGLARRLTFHAGLEPVPWPSWNDRASASP